MPEVVTTEEENPLKLAKNINMAKLIKGEDVFDWIGDGWVKKNLSTPMDLLLLWKWYNFEVDKQASRIKEKTLKDFYSH